MDQIVKIGSPFFLFLLRIRIGTKGEIHPNSYLLDIEKYMSKELELVWTVNNLTDPIKHSPILD